MFLLRLVCAHLINVNNCCYGRCYGKSRILLIGFLKSRCFNAGNRVRLFQDSIPKCSKFKILPFKKKWLLQPNITFLDYKTTLGSKFNHRRFDIVLFFFFLLAHFAERFFELLGRDTRCVCEHLRCIVVSLSSKFNLLRFDIILCPVWVVFGNTGLSGHM